MHVLAPAALTNLAVLGVQWRTGNRLGRAGALLIHPATAGQGVGFRVTRFKARFWGPPHPPLCSFAPHKLPPDWPPPCACGALFPAGIGKVGAQAFAEVVAHNTSLLLLDLSGNRLGPAGAHALADALTASRRGAVTAGRDGAVTAGGRRWHPGAGVGSGASTPLRHASNAGAAVTAEAPCVTAGCDGGGSPAALALVVSLADVTYVGAKELVDCVANRERQRVAAQALLDAACARHGAVTATGTTVSPHAARDEAGDDWDGSFTAGSRAVGCYGGLLCGTSNTRSQAAAAAAATAATGRQQGGVAAAEPNGRAGAGPLSPSPRMSDLPNIATTSARLPPTSDGPSQPLTFLPATVTAAEAGGAAADRSHWPRSRHQRSQSEPLSMAAVKATLRDTATAEAVMPDVAVTVSMSDPHAPCVVVGGLPVVLVAGGPSCGLTIESFIPHIVHIPVPMPSQQAQTADGPSRSSRNSYQTRSTAPGSPPPAATTARAVAHPLPPPAGAPAPRGGFRLVLVCGSSCDEPAAAAVTGAGAVTAKSLPELLTAPHLLFDHLSHLSLRGLALGDVGAAAVAECIREARSECWGVCALKAKRTRAPIIFEIALVHIVLCGLVLCGACVFPKHRWGCPQQ